MGIIISNIIKEQRQRLGVNQETLANKFGVSVQAVSKWENGSSCPDITLLPEIADYFGVTIDYLLTGRVTAAITDDASDTSEIYTVAGNSEITDKCPSADTIYFVEVLNGHIISTEKLFSDTVQLSIPEELTHGAWNISIHAPVSFGSVRGNVTVSENGEAAFNGGVFGPVGIKDSSGSIGFNSEINGDVTITNVPTASLCDVSGDVYITGGKAVVNGQIKICGDFNGNISTENSSISVERDFTGNVATESGDISVSGDLTCEEAATLSGSFTISGDVTGSISVESGDVSVGGDVTGNVSVEGGDLNVEGDINSDVSVEGGDLNVEGDIYGNASSNDCGDINIGGDVNGNVSSLGSGDIHIEGDVDGSVYSSGSGDLSVGGDVDTLNDDED